MRAIIEGGDTDTDFIGGAFDLDSELFAAGGVADEVAGFGGGGPADEGFSFSVAGRIRGLAAETAVAFYGAFAEGLLRCFCFGHLAGFPLAVELSSFLGFAVEFGFFEVSVVVGVF